MSIITSLISRKVSIPRRLGFAAALALIACGGGFSPAHGAAPITYAIQTQARQVQAVADRLPEVRLRKLHLVRPDLIFYPISYEVVC